MAAPLHYSSWPWPARRPSPQADQTTFPNRPAEEQLCNGVQFLCTNASLAPKVHTGLPSCQGEGGGEGLLRGWRWLARIVGKEGGSSANWQDCLHQLGGGYYCRHRRGKKNRGRLSRFQTVAIDARPWSQGLGGLNDQGADRKEGKNNLLFTTHHFLSPLILFSAPAPPTSLLSSGCGRHGRVLLLSPLAKLKLRPLGADNKVHKAIEQVQHLGKQPKEGGDDAAEEPKENVNHAQLRGEVGAVVVVTHV